MTLSAAEMVFSLAESLLPKKTNNSKLFAWRFRPFQIAIVVVVASAMSDEGITLSSSTKGGHSANVQHTNTGPTTSQSTEVVEDASELLFPDEFKDAQVKII